MEYEGVPVALWENQRWGEGELGVRRWVSWVMGGGSGSCDWAVVLGWCCVRVQGPTQSLGGDQHAQLLVGNADDHPGHLLGQALN